MVRFDWKRLKRVTHSWDLKSSRKSYHFSCDPAGATAGLDGMFRFVLVIPSCWLWEIATSWAVKISQLARIVWRVEPEKFMMECRDSTTETGDRNCATPIRRSGGRTQMLFRVDITKKIWKLKQQWCRMPTDQLIRTVLRLPDAHSCGCLYGIRKPLTEARFSVLV
jgi:hypothetical protein